MTALMDAVDSGAYDVLLSVLSLAVAICLAIALSEGDET